MSRSLVFALLLAVATPLSAAPPDPAALPDAAVHRFGNRQLRHPDTVYSTQVSPDGKLLATASNQTVIIWDLDTLHPKCILRGQSITSYLPDPGPGRIAFTADSKGLLVTSAFRGGGLPFRPGEAASATDVATVYDLDTGKPRFTLKGDQDYFRTAWASGGGKELVVVSRMSARFYDARDGKELKKVALRADSSGPAWVAPAADLLLTSPFRPNGQMGISVLDARAGKEVYTAEVNGRLMAAALSPDGKRLVIHDPVGKIRVHDLEAKKELYAFDHPAGQQRGPMRVSADGRTLYLGGQHGQIFRWDLAENRKLPDVGRHSSWTLTSLALSPDESMLYSAGADKVVRRWDLKTGKQLPLPDGYITQTAVAPTPDGKHLLVADHGGALDLYDLATGKREKAIISSVGMHGMDCVAVSDDGRWFAGGRTVQDIRLYDLKAGKEERVIPLVEKPDPKGSDHVKRVAFGPGGKVLYSASAQTGTTAWEVPTGKQLWRTGTAPVLAVDPLGRYVAVGGGFTNDVIRYTLLDAATGQVVRTVDVAPESEPDPTGGQVGTTYVYPPYLSDLKFTPDGSRLVSGHYDGTTRLWDPDTGKLAAKLKDTYKGLAGVACSPDSKWVAVGQTGGKIVVWELSTQKVVLTLTGHDSLVRDVVFTPDGRGLIGNADLSPVLWDLVPKDLHTAETPDAVWKDLASNDAERAYRLSWGLVRDPRAAVKLFSEKVKPAELAIDRAQFDKWLAALDSPQFRAREAAEKGLTAAGARVPVGWLRKALADTRSDEVRARLGRVLAVRDKPLPDEWRLSRAVQVLERAGTAEAKALLKAWGNAPEGTQVHVEAAAALRRVGGP